MRNRLALAVLLLLCVGAAFSQQYGMGLVFEEDVTAKIPRKPTLLTRSYENLPRSYSLKKYAPSVKHQTGGTCVGWSSAYAARTITEAGANGWTDREKIDQEAYSPNFMFRIAKTEPGCEKGTYITAAIKKLKEVGAVKKSEVEDVCLTDVPAWLLPKAGEHRIDAYFTTFSQEDPSNFKVAAVKKAISQDKPVVIGMPVYESFKSLGSNGVWNGFATSANIGGHAMCVIGYDDDKEGGAFEIMNSWGTRWGDNGFVWIKYDDFGKHARYGHDIYVQPKQQTNMSGSMQFKLSTGEEMKSVLRNESGLPTYKMTRGYISGTRFRIYLSNDNPAYVYVLGSDLNNDVSKIFPHNERVSAALFYKKNDIALPDEEHLFEFDDTKGTTYALILYSLRELPIDEIVRKIRGNSGGFAQKTKSAIGGELVPFDEINLERQSIKFSSKSKNTVVAIVVETEHKE
jgi:hypothetical protein